MCEHKVTIKLSSIQKQICADCNKTMPWPLKENQPPLVTSSRDKRKRQISFQNYSEELKEMMK